MTCFVGCVPRWSGTCTAGTRRTAMTVPWVLLPANMNSLARAITVNIAPGASYPGWNRSRRAALCLFQISDYGNFSFCQEILFPRARRELSPAGNRAPPFNWGESRPPLFSTCRPVGDLRMNRAVGHATMGGVVMGRICCLNGGLFRGFSSPGGYTWARVVIINFPTPFPCGSALTRASPILAVRTPRQ